MSTRLDVELHACGLGWVGDHAPRAVIPAKAGIHVVNERFGLNAFIQEAKLAVLVDPGVCRGDGLREA